MLCKNCKHCKTKSVGQCGSSRSYCLISKGSIIKGTKLGVQIWKNTEHPKCPLRIKENRYAE